ncbi:hypothetical protein DTO207G8_4472 [Paecilomyces variotii]|nr:hypothetical protein DTO207G8_4472 [Paecilomyces variotii]
MTPMPTRELDSNPRSTKNSLLIGSGFARRQDLNSTGPPCGELVFSNFIFAPDRASDRGPPASWSLRIRVPVYEPEAYFLPVYLSIIQVDGFALSRRPRRLQSIEVGIRLSAKGRGASRSFWRLHDDDNAFFSDREPGTILQYHRVSTAYYYSSERSNKYTESPKDVWVGSWGPRAPPDQVDRPSIARCTMDTSCQPDLDGKRSVLVTRWQKHTNIGRLFCPSDGKISYVHLYLHVSLMSYTATVHRWRKPNPRR